MRPLRDSLPAEPSVILANVRGSSRPLSDLERRISAFLEDGTPRTASEVAVGVADSADFIARREAAREVTRSLASLRTRGVVQRLQFRFLAVDGTYQPVEKYAATAMIGPVCLPCWKRHWASGREVAPPYVTGFPTTICSICGGASNHGTYVPISEIREKRDA